MYSCINQKTKANRTKSVFLNIRTENFLSIFHNDVAKRRLKCTVCDFHQYVISLNIHSTEKYVK